MLMMIYAFEKQGNPERPRHARHQAGQVTTFRNPHHNMTPALALAQVPAPVPRVFF